MKSILKYSLALFFFLSLNKTWAQKITRVADMQTARVLHQMQSLPNGEVLVFGGTQAAAPFFQPTTLGSCEIYNPTNNSWRDAANLTNERFEFSSVRLPSGKILAIGGEGLGGGVLSSVEEYDPQSNTWTVIGQLAFPSKGGDAVIDDNGTIILTGSANNKFQTSNDNGATWTELPMPNGMGMPSLSRGIKLNDGRVIFAGGPAGGAKEQVIIITNGTIVDTSANRFTNHPRASLAILPDGKVLIGGGDAGKETEIFDPTNLSTSPTGTGFLNRLGTPYLPMSDGRIANFLIGNSLNTQNGLDKEILEIYDPASGEWEQILGHDFFGTELNEVADLGNGKYLITGGVTNLQPSTAGSVLSYIFDENGVISGVEDLTENIAQVYYSFEDKTLNLINTSESASKLELTIFDLMGKKFHQQTTDSRTTKIQLSELNAGIYFTLIKEEGSHRFYHKKILVH